MADPKKTVKKNLTKKSVKEKRRLKDAREDAKPVKGKRAQQTEAAALAAFNADAASRPAMTEHMMLTAKKSDPAENLAFAIECARLIRDDKCEGVVLLDVRHVSSVTDYIVVASGTSDRQMRSVLKHLDELGEEKGFPSMRRDSDDRATWLLIDFVDVVCHLFEPNTRSHYDIEMLWGDAPRVEWERPDQMERDRAGLAASNAPIKSTPRPRVMKPKIED